MKELINNLNKSVESYENHGNKAALALDFCASIENNNRCLEPELIIKIVKLIRNEAK